MPLVSVIIPVYNKEDSIRQTIESVLHQTFRDFELILVNDGSTDSSGHIASAFQGIDSRVKYCHQENQGVSAARNKGIDLAKGKYITFLDADDRWNLRFLEHMVNAIGDGNVCYCGHVYYINGKKKRSKLRFYSGDIVDKYVKNITTPNTNSWLIRKEYIEKYDIRFPLGLNWGEDMLFFLATLTHEKNVTYVRKYLTEYHLSDTNCLSENSMDKIEKDLIWMELAKKYICANEVDPTRKRKVVEAFDSYRIPAAIIYRIFLNLETLKRDDTVIRSYRSHIDKMKMSNGLRSIKLLFYKRYICTHLKIEC